MSEDEIEHPGVQRPRVIAAIRDQAKLSVSQAAQLFREGQSFDVVFDWHDREKAESLSAFLEACGARFKLMRG